MHSGRSSAVVSTLIALLAVSCNGGGGGGGGSNDIVSVVQDLSVDPTGRTTVVTFESDAGTLDIANFDADGAQNATAVTQNGAEYTVEWDARVSPADQVRALGVDDVAASFRAVSTSDSSAPTFAITTATQVAGLGLDTVSVQFSGPYVIESEAEDVANWTLKVGTTTLSLAGSTFTLDEPTQVLSITTGPLANLHASFTLAAKSTLHSVADVSLATTAVAGVASGDVTAPGLVSVEQNLAEDEYGRVVDLTFDEAMDPVFCASLSNFHGGGSDVATTFEQPTASVLRVTFNNPMVPGVNTLDLEGLMDAHGNALPDQNVAIVAGSTVANSFVTTEVTTVAGVGGDFLEVVFAQAIDPDDATVATKWNLEIPTGNPLDLSGCTLGYDLAAKTLTVELDIDVVNGTTFTFEAASGNEPLDVDGETFGDSTAGLASGESTAPSVVTVTQNRVFDPTGVTLDVVFTEALEETSAETLGNWNVPGHTVQTATLLSAQNTVRIACDALVLPGTDTLDASGVLDLAGNTMTAAVGHAIASTDATAPSATSLSAQAIEGEGDDVVRVHFNDNLLESEIEDESNWTLESPVGTTLTLTGASIVWNDGGRQATVTLPAGTNLLGGNTVRASFAGVHDIAGNAITATAVSAAATAESNFPTVDAVWVKTAQTNHVTVRFSEPCTNMDDIAGLTSYAVRNAAGILKGTPTTAVESVDHLGVELVFGFAVVAGSDTLDIAGVTDLAGNSMFPVEDHAVAAQDGTAVDFDAGASALTATSGESNDEIEVVFTARPSLWTLLDPDHYTVSLLGVPLDLSGASFAYDGNLTVTILLDGNAAANLQTGATYDVDVEALASAQGVAGAAMSGSVVCGGETTAPALPAGLTRLDAASPTDSVLIQFDEAVDLASAETETNYDLNGGANPDTVVRVGLTTVRAFWSGGVILGDTVNCTVADLAGNVGVLSRAVTAAEVQGPLVVSVQAVSVANTGLDYVTVEYDKPIDTLTGLDPANYGVTNGSPLALTGAILSFESSSDTVTIHLPAGVELDPTAGLVVTVQDVEDHAGLSMSPPANIGGAVSGDLTAPDFEAAFTNWRADVFGTAVDVRFTEDVPAAFVTNLTNWTVSGGQTVDAVTVIKPSHVRLTLSLPLSVGETLGLVGLPDMAGNASGAIAIAPAF